MRSVDPSLQVLFVLLRNAGIIVGLEEIRRLGAVFATAPELDESGLLMVIELICVKSQDQRDTLRRIYRQWLDVVGKQLDKAEVERSRASLGYPSKSQHVRSGEMASGDFDEGYSSPNAPRSGRFSTIDSVVGLKPLEPKIRPTGPIDPEADDESEAAAGDKPSSREGEVPGRAQTATFFRPSPRPYNKPNTVVGLEAPPSRSRLATVGFFLLFLALIALLWWALAVWRSGPDGPLPAIDAGNREQPVFIASNSRIVYRPELAALAADGPPWNLLGYGTLLTAMVMGMTLWWRRGRGRWLPEPRRTQAVPGVLPVPMVTQRSAAVAPGGLFLDQRDEENLVWGVDRFVSEEPGRELDVLRTVQETASAYGRPVLCYEHASYQREVWLWIDESLDSPVARHLARDLTRILELSGLPVITFNFWGIPYQFRTKGDEIVTVDELEARRETAAVAILTDGRLVAAAHRSRGRRDELLELLRNLSYWPRITIVDFSRQSGRLTSIVGTYGLRVIRPEDAPSAVSDVAEAGERATSGRLVGDARVWAAACAIAAHPVDDPTALKLRHALGLEVSPWAIETLRRHADSHAGGMAWTSGKRASLLGWLLDAEQLPDRELPPDRSLLARILRIWDRILRERDENGKREVNGWDGSIAQARVRMERALIHLWHRPDEAATTLYALFQGELQTTIAKRLAEMAPREGADDPMSVPLPWSLRHRRHDTQVMLTEMGLGTRARLSGRRSLPRPGRLVLSLCMCVGLTIGSSGALVRDCATRDVPEPQLVDAWPGDKPALHNIYQVGAINWEVVAYTPWVPDELSRLTVSSGQDYEVSGVQLAVECTENVGRSTIRRCCGRVQLRDPLPDIWSFAVMRRNPFSDDLAETLLCSGSADVVYLLGRGDDMPAWSSWAQRTSDAQLLVIDEQIPESLEDFLGRAVVVSTDRIAGLLEVTRFDGEASLAERLPNLRVLSGDPDNFRVQGVGACGEEGQKCCDPEGSGSFSCAIDLACVDGTCVRGVECNPGSRRCYNGGVIACDEDGREQSWVPCELNQECVDGRCVDARCQPGALRCEPDGAAVLACDRDGNWQTETVCDEHHLCREQVCREIIGADVVLELTFSGHSDDEGDDGASQQDEGANNSMEPARLPTWVRQVVCTVNGDAVTWAGQSPPSRYRAQRRRVRFDAGQPERQIEITCWLRRENGASQLQTRRHPWNLSVEGGHSIALPPVPALNVEYRIGMRLADPSPAQKRAP